MSSPEVTSVKLLPIHSEWAAHHSACVYVQCQLHKVVDGMASAHKLLNCSCSWLLLCCSSIWLVVFDKQHALLATRSLS